VIASVDSCQAGCCSPVSSCGWVKVLVGQKGKALIMVLSVYVQEMLWNGNMLCKSFSRRGDGLNGNKQGLKGNKWAIRFLNIR
jgi:hypothetical protein